MIRKIMIIGIAAMFFTIATAEISAQDVLMNSAETINQGNLKAAVFPTFLFGKNGNDSVFGVGGRIGFGLLSRIDIEAKAAIFKGITYFGADIEWWFIHGRNFNVSAALGGHMTNYSQGTADSYGIDTTLLVSTAPVKNLELYGGLKFAFDSVKDTDQNFTLIHFVPGIEYRINASIDFLAEFGIALNGNSRHYASVGFALYLLR